MVSAKSTLELKPRFTRDDLRELAGAGDGWRLSLFMPLARTGRDVRQAPILLKDLRARAAQELEAREVASEAREGMLAAVDQILRDSDTSVLQGEGLAIFASEHHAFSYLLPVSPEASVGVDRRFRLDPILPLLFEDGRFYLLALGLKDVKLFEGDRMGLSEIPMAGISDNMREALRFEDSESYLNFHTSTGSPGFGMRPPMYFGHGGGKGDVKEMKRDILRFFQQLDGDLRPRMPDPARPLLLAGVEGFLAIYREANTRSRILDVSLPAHLEKFFGTDELHAQAWGLFEREAKAERKALFLLYRERLASSYTAAGISDVLPMADQGRLSHLFIRRGYRAHGAYEPGTGKVNPTDPPRPGDEDLVSLAAVQAIMGGGKVYVVEPGDIPEGADIAALCRY